MDTLNCHEFGDEADLLKDEDKERYTRCQGILAEMNRIDQELMESGAFDHMEGDEFGEDLKATMDEIDSDKHTEDL